MFVMFLYNRRHGGTGGSLDTGRQDFLVYVLSLLRGHSNEHGASLPQMDVSSLPHVAYVLDALVYYVRNNPNASSQVKQSSVEKTAAAAAADAVTEDEGGDDVDDEDSASFKRDAEEYDDDTDHVEDEPMPTPNTPGHLHRYEKRKGNSIYYINCSVLQGFLPPRNVVSEHT